MSKQLKTNQKGKLKLRKGLSRNPQYIKDLQKTGVENPWHFAGRYQLLEGTLIASFLARQILFARAPPAHTPAPCISAALAKKLLEILPAIFGSCKEHEREFLLSFCLFGHVKLPTFTVRARLQLESNIRMSIIL